MLTLDDFLAAVKALEPTAPLHPYVHFLVDPGPIADWFKANGEQYGADLFEAWIEGIQVRVTVNRRIG